MGLAAHEPWKISAEWMEQQAAIDRHAAELRDKRLRWIWSGIGWACFAVLIVGSIMVGVVLAFRAAEQHGQHSIDLEHERSEQVRACVDLGEPIERQYCLLAIATPPLEGAKDE